MRILVVLGLLTLPACAPFAGVEGASFIATDKLLSDHAISFASGKDCSAVRVSRGLTYCVEDEETVVFQEAYCYPSLGRITCYDRPAFDEGQQRVGYAPKPVKDPGKDP